ncbi:hypothetical protein F0L17_06505 [Streptomyces sp. TRM43335]|uniref:Uncharacterized protein n=1 Tax=Streptomyces taklimakanensis TaxID=2569853 RepID=A0A6G2B948_9ACTN|nr:hypothetical protein [Streptomyces taklimakanensis]MTE18791.1 hypothetical protein [Streptomyces taklimakanensis]
MRVRRTPEGCSTRETEAARPRSRGRRLAAAGNRCRRTARAGARWAARRRNVAADQFLRGACYGAGATAVSLLAVWARTR